MSKAATNAENSEGALYPIRTVAELTGVNAITLRAWETRHDLIQPIRKDSGHRLYTQEQIDLITRVVGLLERGMRIGQVKQLLDSEQLPEGDSEPAEPLDRWARSRHSMLAAVIRFDEIQLDAVYSEALSHYDVNTVTERLLMPLLADLGKRWESGQGSVAEEHFFGFYLRNKLGARFHHLRIDPNGVPLVMACLPGERHEVGLLLFALAASEAGYRPVILGSDLPLKEIPPAVEKTGAAAVILSGSLDPDSLTVKKDLPALSLAVDVPVLLGGKLSVRLFDALKRAGIEPLGLDIEKGVQRLSDLVPSKAGS